MVKFVEIEGAHGSRWPVNPEAVAYLRPAAEGNIGIVFGAVSGGFHELVVNGPVERVQAALEGAETPTAARKGSGTSRRRPGALPGPPAAPARPDTPAPL